MRFSEIIGNTDIKEYLQNSVKNSSISQSYLFSGNDGIGKLLIAREFAKKILCLNNGDDDCDCKSCKCIDGGNHPDLNIINEEGETIKIEKIRELTNKVIERPIISAKKVYIINDSDRMTVEAQNCLLKTLEEPPEFVVIILITSNENMLLNTIHSRCMTIKFKNIPDDELEKYAKDELGYLQMTKNMLKSFNGSIGKAIIQKENSEKYLQVENIVNSLENSDIIDIMNSAKVIYDKENIQKILEYMIVCTYAKSKENIKYINCIERIDKCNSRLKRNCNFDMSLDTMFLDMWRDLRNK